MRAEGREQWQADTALGRAALQRISEKEARFSQQNTNMNIMNFTSTAEHRHSRSYLPPPQLQEQMLEEEYKSKAQHSNTYPEHPPSPQRSLDHALPDPACSSVFNTLNISLSRIYQLAFTASSHHTKLPPHPSTSDILTSPKLKLKGLTDTPGRRKTFPCRDSRACWARYRCPQNINSSEP